MTPPERRLWVAIDVAEVTAARRWLDRLDHWQAACPLPEGFVLGAKVGLQLFTAAGPQPLQEWRRRWPLFLDLKLHDIPATVAGAAAAAAQLGVDTLTVHLAGGTAMLRAAREAAPRLRLMGVTVLTSLGAADLAPWSTPWPMAELVARWAETAATAGLTGVVVAASELARVRARFPQLAAVVPALRWTAVAGDDQKRVATPAEALRLGATDLVVGRALTAAADPTGAWRQLTEVLWAAAAG